MNRHGMGTLVVALLAVAGLIAALSLGAEEPESSQAVEEPAPGDPVPLTIDVTDAFPLGEGDFDQGSAAGDYCTYRILSASGPACGPFTVGALICVDCPASNSCPGPAGGQRSGYRYLGPGGVVKCRGQWVKRFDVNNPSACVNCPIDGVDGFVFVN